MNFIKHFKGWITRIQTDSRLKPHHVSLYTALFQNWNASHFQNPITIFRHEIMGISKIGSLNTYTKSLRELTEWGYIRYDPSFDPQIGSKVHLVRFDTGSNKGTGKGGSKGSDKGTSKGIDKRISKGPSKGSDKGRATYYTNNPNVLNSTNNLNDINADEPNNKISDVIDDRKTDTYGEAINSDGLHGADGKAKGQTPGGRGGQAKRAIREAVPDTLEKVQAYFSEVNAPTTEAERFFNYFESNGWKVGGKTAMKDWRAAARNWILNAKNFTNGNATQPKPGQLNTGPKNYAEPF